MTANDSVGGGGIVVLANGNYVVSSTRWSSGSAVAAGAATWADGTLGRSGAVSTANSMVGAYDYNYLGAWLTALVDGNYFFAGANGQGSYSISSVTLANGDLGATGTVQPSNTMFANIGYATFGLDFPYDASRARLVVGRPHENIVTLFSINDTLFAGNFE